MPQVAKSKEQVLLEERISKATTLVKTMRLQLASVRKRNKAERERARLSSKCKSLEQKGEQEFLKLMEDVNHGAILVPNSHGMTVDPENQKAVMKNNLDGKNQKSEVATTTASVNQFGGSSSSKSKQ